MARIHLSEGEGEYWEKMLGVVKAKPPTEPERDEFDEAIKKRMRAHPAIKAAQERRAVAQADKAEQDAKLAALRAEKYASAVPSVRPMPHPTHYRFLRIRWALYGFFWGWVMHAIYLASAR
jgi:hypothetical protein